MLLYANGDSHTAPWSYIDIIGEEFAFQFVMGHHHKRHQKINTKST